MNPATCPPIHRSKRAAARVTVAMFAAATGAWPAATTHHDGARFGHYPNGRTTRRGGTPH